MKRRLREAVRLHLARAAGILDDRDEWPRRALLDAEFPKIEREVERLFAQCENS